MTIRKPSGSEYPSGLSNGSQPIIDVSANGAELSPARWGLGVLVMLAIAYTFFFASSLLLPVFLALFFAILLRPGVDQLRRLGVPEAPGAVLVIALALTALGIGITILSAPLETWVDRIPLLLPEIKAKLREIMESVEQAQEVTKQIEEAASVDDEAATAVVAGPGLAEQAAGGLTAFAITILATVVLLYFLLANGRRTVGRMLVAIKDPERRARWETVIEQIQMEIAAYLLAVTVINIALGIAVGVVMMLLGMPNPVLWGVLTALLNFLPYVGPLAMFVIVGVVSLVTFDSWVQIALPLVALTALTALEGQFLTPSILGKRLTLNPIAVFLSMLFWGWLWGMAGAFLAVPILVAIRVMARHVDVMAFLRPLLR
jgi:predicted PurR-regulated permease PerM